MRAFLIIVAVSCGAPYCLEGYSPDGMFGYWTKEAAISDAKKWSAEGFPIKVWKSFGKLIFPEE
jgi:hypothetical protein